MNYLAHAYLSFMHEDILIGNMISDFVKGKRKFDYSINIQKGITLHRLIDSFTDDHSATKQAKQFFKPAVGLYAGAFMDIVYDHFLALNSESWNEKSLSSFSQYVYQTLDEKYALLPEKLQRMLPYMKAQDWLTNYQHTWGIERSFEGVTRRAAYLDSSAAVYEAFIENYDELRVISLVFLSDVKKYASERFEILITA